MGKLEPERSDGLQELKASLKRVGIVIEEVKPPFGPILTDQQIVDANWRNPTDIAQEFKDVGQNIPKSFTNGHRWRLSGFKTGGEWMPIGKPLQYTFSFLYHLGQTPDLKVIEIRGQNIGDRFADFQYYTDRADKKKLDPRYLLSRKLFNRLGKIEDSDRSKENIEVTLPTSLITIEPFLTANQLTNFFDDEVLLEKEARLNFRWPHSGKSEPQLPTFNSKTESLNSDNLQTRYYITDEFKLGYWHDTVGANTRMTFPDSSLFVNPNYVIVSLFARKLEDEIKLRKSNPQRYESKVQQLDAEITRVRRQLTDLEDLRVRVDLNSVIRQIQTNTKILGKIKNLPDLFPNGYEEARFNL